MAARWEPKLQREIEWHQPALETVCAEPNCIPLGRRSAASTCPRAIHPDQARRQRHSAPPRGPRWLRSGPSRPGPAEARTGAANDLHAPSRRRRGYTFSTPAADRLWWTAANDTLRGDLPADRNDRDLAWMRQVGYRHLGVVAACASDQLSTHAIVGPPAPRRPRPRRCDGARHGYGRAPFHAGRSAPSRPATIDRSRDLTFRLVPLRPGHDRSAGREAARPENVSRSGLGRQVSRWTAPESGSPRGLGHPDSPLGGDRRHQPPGDRDQLALRSRLPARPPATRPAGEAPARAHSHHPEPNRSTRRPDRWSRSTAPAPPAANASPRTCCALGDAVLRCRPRPTSRASRRRRSNWRRHPRPCTVTRHGGGTGGRQRHLRRRARRERTAARFETADPSRRARPAPKHHRPPSPAGRLELWTAPDHAVAMVDPESLPAARATSPITIPAPMISPFGSRRARVAHDHDRDRDRRGTLRCPGQRVEAQIGWSDGPRAGGSVRRHRSSSLKGRARSTTAALCRRVDLERQRPVGVDGVAQLEQQLGALGGAEGGDAVGRRLGARAAAASAASRRTG